MKIQLNTNTMTDGFTICDNRILSSKELTPDAKFLYFWILSKPADFRFYGVDNIANLSGLGIRPTRNALKLLEKRKLIKMSLVYNGKNESHSGRELEISIFDYSHFVNNQNVNNQNVNKHFVKHNNKREEINKEKLKNKEISKNKEKKQIKSACAFFECENSAFEKSNQQSDLSVKKPKAKKTNSALNITNAFNAHKDKIHHFTLADVLEFAKHRDEIKKPITETGAVKIINKLIKLGIGAYDSIENSITNGWQGLFEPRKINFENSAYARERNKARGDLAKKYVTTDLNDRYYSDDDLKALNFQKSNTEDFDGNN